MRRIAFLRAAAIAVLAASGACTIGARIPRADIQSPDSLRRALAVQAAARDNDREAIPLIIDRLEDEDDAVRFYAILALERLTGESFGYEYYKPAALQVAAIERWRDYARENAGRAASRPAFQPVAAGSAPTDGTDAPLGAAAAGRDSAGGASALQQP